MMTSSNGNIFHVTGHLCGEFTGPQIFDLRLNKRLSKQSLGWWFEMQSHHYYVIVLKTDRETDSIATGSRYNILKPEIYWQIW